MKYPDLNISAWENKNLVATWLDIYTSDRKLSNKEVEQQEVEQQEVEQQEVEQQEAEVYMSPKNEYFCLTPKNGSA